MTTSGTSTLTPTRDQIIRQAALEVSAIGIGTTMSAEMMQDFAFRLNAMVKHWQGRGIHIWTVKQATLFPVAGQSRYLAGTGATDHVTESWSQTTVSADEASAQTVISLTSTAAMAVADNIGILLNSGAVHWTTVSSKTSTTATIAAALPAAASAGNEVFTYTRRIPKPVRVLLARRYLVSSATETPIDLVSHEEYRALPNKASVGSINQVQYDPQRVQGQFNLWSVPAVLTELLNFTYLRPFDVFSAGGDSADFPEEWTSALIWNLAKEMMGRYPVNPERRRIITESAATSLIDAEGFGREAESVFFQPALRR